MATTLLRPDQTFHPSPRLAAEAPPETLAYLVTFDPTRKKPDTSTRPIWVPKVLDLRSTSSVLVVMGIVA
ncbi:MAG TPA: hypothetical protein VNA65_05565 [Candidatus Dormibacteraeota bacterium]|nr:hypothetical protein [Candidatus Dormibacteraeota bacterium]